MLYIDKRVYPYLSWGIDTANWNHGADTHVRFCAIGCVLDRMEASGPSNVERANVIQCRYPVLSLVNLRRIHLCSEASAVKRSNLSLTAYIHPY